MSIEIEFHPEPSDKRRLKALLEKLGFEPARHVSDRTKGFTGGVCVRLGTVQVPIDRYHVPPLSDEERECLRLGGPIAGAHRVPRHHTASHLRFSTRTRGKK